MASTKAWCFFHLVDIVASFYEHTANLDRRWPQNLPKFETFYQNILIVVGADASQIPRSHLKMLEKRNC